MVYDVTHLQKRAKTTMTWHGVRFETSTQISSAGVPKLNLSRLRRRGRTCYFGPQPKFGAPGTMEKNPIDIDIDNGPGELTQETAVTDNKKKKKKKKKALWKP
jgi:hypothetical protein